MNPVVSVIIPAYNRPAELQRALSSLVSQTFRQFEVIVCDDGSTEDIHSVVESFVGLLDITYRRIENSGGPARPRNVAASLAKGEWLSFLDSDDWWFPNRLETLYFHIDKPDISIVYHRLKVEVKPGLLNPREKREAVGSFVGLNPLIDFLCAGNPLPNSATMVRRNVFQAVNGFDERSDLVSVEDFDLWLRLAECGLEFRFVDDLLGAYWVGEDAISSISPLQIKRLEFLYQQHLPFLSGDDREKAESFLFYQLGSLYLKIDKYSALALDFLNKAKSLRSIELKVKRVIKIVYVAMHRLARLGHKNAGH